MNKNDIEQLKKDLKQMGKIIWANFISAYKVKSGLFKNGQYILNIEIDAVVADISLEKGAERITIVTGNYYKGCNTYTYLYKNDRWALK